MWNTIFLITGVFFILLLLLMTFAKETIKTEENRCFKLLIIINCIDYVIEILLQFFIRNYGAVSFVSILFARLYLVA